jgi:hypothetical protein
MFSRKDKLVGKKRNVCIYCKEPYQKGRGWHSQKGMVWAEGETEEEGKPYQLFWHSDCSDKQDAISHKESDRKRAMTKGQD